MGIGPAVAIPEVLKQYEPPPLSCHRNNRAAYFCSRPAQHQPPKNNEHQRHTPHRTGYTKDEIDSFELNEAFASQALYCMDTLGLDKAKVNPNGGAIALGHPLGATGTRCTVTLLHHLQETKKNTGVVSMCIGTGMGAAAVFTRE